MALRSNEQPDSILAEQRSPEYLGEVRRLPRYPQVKGSAAASRERSMYGGPPRIDGEKPDRSCFFCEFGSVASAFTCSSDRATQSQLERRRRNDSPGPQINLPRYRQGGPLLRHERGWPAIPPVTWRLFQIRHACQRNVATLGHSKAWANSQRSAPLSRQDFGLR